VCDATEVSKLTITTPAVCTACSRKYVHLVRGGITTAEELAASGDDLACEPSAKRLFKFMRPDSVGAFRACVTVWLCGCVCVAVVVWLWLYGCVAPGVSQSRTSVVQAKDRGRSRRGSANAQLPPCRSSSRWM